ncbi:barstar family protein [Serinibacter arcticus]|uniref:barstar family protein n=1 Tax=Serinibacter arcticus TaxID=1655435 RepID=UPI00109256DD|nr:barstar family protein [Serinibacter arcticus]
MGAFDPNDDIYQDLAFRLLMNGPVTLFWRTEVLTSTIEDLAADGYQIVTLDASAWASDADLHQSVATALDFPAYYGRNFDALNDCLSDVAERRYGWSPGAAGLVLILTRYDALARSSPRSAQLLLDLVASQSRVASLFGGRWMCLVQSDDPAIEFGPLGATSATWNDREWPAADRVVE